MRTWLWSYYSTDAAPVSHSISMFVTALSWHVTLVKHVLCHCQSEIIHIATLAKFMVFHFSCKEHLADCLPWIMDNCFVHVTSAFLADNSRQVKDLSSAQFTEDCSPTVTRFQHCHSIQASCDVLPWIVERCFRPCGHCLIMAFVSATLAVNCHFNRSNEIQFASPLVIPQHHETWDVLDDCLRGCQHTLLHLQAQTLKCHSLYHMHSSGGLADVECADSIASCGLVATTMVAIL